VPQTPGSRLGILTLPSVASLRFSPNALAAEVFPERQYLFQQRAADAGGWPILAVLFFARVGLLFASLFAFIA